MHPLGGLAFADCPRRPWPNFVTSAGGPLVNVVICIITAVWLAVMAGTWRIVPWRAWTSTCVLVWHSQTAFFVWWIFLVSYALLLFNLLPIFPLDGGQMLQSILWKKFGYYRSMYFATVTGMIGASIVGVYGLVRFSILLVVLALIGFQTCLGMYRQLKANGPWAYEDEDSPYAASLVGDDRRQRKLSAKAAKQNAAAAKAAEKLTAKKRLNRSRSTKSWRKFRARHGKPEQRRKEGAATGDGAPTARDSEMSKARRRS